MANKARGPARVKVPPDVKLRWCQRGAYALALTVPRAAHLGDCAPLCIRAARNVNNFSIEDVPPRRVGGAPLVLTCHQCNRRAGQLVDVHLCHLTDVEEFMRGELVELLRVAIRQGRDRVVVNLTSIDGSVHMVVAPEGWTGFKLSTDSTFNVTFPNRFRYGRAIVSVLRASYLAAFSALGYRPLKYWGPIREQIQQPRVIREEVVRPVKYERDQPKERRQLGHAVFDEGPIAVYVGLGRWTTLLPLAPDSEL